MTVSDDHVIAGTALVRDPAHKRMWSDLTLEMRNILCAVNHPYTCAELAEHFAMERSRMQARMDGLASRWLVFGTYNTTRRAKVWRRTMLAEDVIAAAGMNIVTLPHFGKVA